MRENSDSVDFSFDVRVLRENIPTGPFIIYPFIAIIYRSLMHAQQTKMHVHTHIFNLMSIENTTRIYHVPTVAESVHSAGSSTRSDQQRMNMITHKIATQTKTVFG